MSRPTSDSPLSRREFLGSSALNAASVAAGVVGLTGAAVAAAGPAETVRVGVIGVRNQGKTLATTFAGLPQVQVAALCDVDANLLPGTGRVVEAIQGTTPRFEGDFRRLLDDPSIDAVAIATPDHWHAPMAILACQAGKDVYVEKPVSHTLQEGPLMQTVAEAERRVVQSGLQQRSGPHFQSAVEYIQSGRLGAVHLAKAWTVHQRKSIGYRKDTLPPPGVDYDLWLGPAPLVAFNPNRFHYNWHWFWDYGSGELGNWGVHLLDVARWGLQVELPTQVSATGGKHYFQDDQQTPDTLHVNYAYPGCTLTWEHRLWSPHGQEGRSAAVAFYGDRGTLIVDRGGWKVYGQRDAVGAEPGELLGPHLQNFIDCVRSRRQPNSNLAIGVTSSDLCHLGNLAFRLGRTLQVHPSTGRVDLSTTERAIVSRGYRAPWSLQSPGMA
jgi:predicted dehydrogenase